MKSQKASKTLAPSKLLAISLLALILLLSNGLATSLAAPAEERILNVVQDSYTDLNAPDTNFNAGLLTAANSPGAPEAADQTTKQIYLQFDLSGVTFEIKSAILSLSTLTCNGLVPVDAVGIVVSGVDNSANWDEATLTWENQPALSTAILDTLDSNTPAFNQAQLLTWTDGYQGAFASWLETQRLAGTQTATLVLSIDNANNPGLADIFFEDHEGTGSTYGCPDALGLPTLTVGSTIQNTFLFLPMLKH